MRFVFFGTENFSVAILEKLINDFYRPELVVTMPDKPVGRKQIITPPPVKEVCKYHDISVLQPEKLNDIEENLRQLDVDLFIVASYGKIIPENILKIPKHSSINVHTSLLPRYRGASPIQASILAGDEKTGVTIMKMDNEMDHGEIVFQKNVDIDADETYRSLHTKLAHISSDVIAKILPDYLKGNLKSYPQEHSEATYTSIITKEDAKIDWNKPVSQIEKAIRAYYDWPVAWTFLPDGKRLKVIEGHFHASQTTEEPGKLKISKNSAGICCADGILELDLVQIEGAKRPVNEEEFVAGYRHLDGGLCK